MTHCTFYHRMVRNSIGPISKGLGQELWDCFLELAFFYTGTMMFYDLVREPEYQPLANKLSIIAVQLLETHILPSIRKRHHKVLSPTPTPSDKSEHLQFLTKRTSLMPADFYHHLLTTHANAHGMRVPGQRRGWLHIQSSKAGKARRRQRKRSIVKSSWGCIF
jgi:hypothetical protein